jgi:hypothetical protein
LIESGSTFRQAAACLNVAPATAHRWWRRWQTASDPDRWAFDRSSRPWQSPAKTPAAEEQRICQAHLRRRVVDSSPTEGLARGWHEGFARAARPNRRVLRIRAAALTGA